MKLFKSIFRMAILLSLVGCSNNGTSSDGKSKPQIDDSKVISQYLESGGQMRQIDLSTIKSTSNRGGGHIASDTHKINRVATPRSILTFHFSRFPEGQFPDLGQPFGVSFGNTSITSESLQRLKHLSNLQYLDLSQAHIVKPELLPTLAEFPNLQTLRLGDLAGRDVELLRDFGLLHKLPNARTNDGGRPLTPDDVVEFSHLDINITVESMACLKTFPNLKRTMDQPYSITTDIFDAYARSDYIYLLNECKTSTGGVPTNNDEVVQFQTANPSTAETRDHYRAGLKNLKNLKVIKIPLFGERRN